MVNKTDLTPGQYTGHDAYVLRAISVAASLLSIITVITVFIWWWLMSISNRIRFQYRHIMILSLLCYDLAKAIILIIYPLIKLHTEESMKVIHQTSMCDAIGFLTEVTIEGADFAVLLLAIHTMTLVFVPHFKDKYLRPKKVFVLFVLLVVPCALAGAGLVKSNGNSGYANFTTWCFLRVYPWWYRLYLSWGPRFCIMGVIVLIYLLIYLQVKHQIRKVENSMMEYIGSDHGSGQVVSNNQDGRVPLKPRLVSLKSARKYGKSCFRLIKKWVSQLPGLGFIYPYDWRSATVEAVRTPSGRLTAATVNQFMLPEGGDNVQQSADNIRSFIGTENYIRFQLRRATVEKQISLLFVYPAVYILIWIFPMLQEILHYTVDADDSPYYGLAIIADWMKPFSGCVNSLVFLFKELKFRVPYSSLRYVVRDTERVRGQGVTAEPYVEIPRPQVILRAHTRSRTRNQVSDQIRTKLGAYKFPSRQPVLHASGPDSRSQKPVSTVDIISPLSPVIGSRSNGGDLENFPTTGESDMDLMDFLRR